MLCYNLYYGYHIKKNLPFDFVTFSVTVNDKKFFEKTSLGERLNCVTELALCHFM